MRARVHVAVRSEHVRGLCGGHVRQFDKRAGVRGLSGILVLDGREHGVQRLSDFLGLLRRKRVGRRVQLHRRIFAFCRPWKARVSAVRCRFLQECRGQQQLHDVLDWILGVGRRELGASVLSGR